MTELDVGVGGASAIVAKEDFELVLVFPNKENEPAPKCAYIDTLRNKSIARGENLVDDIIDGIAPSSIRLSGGGMNIDVDISSGSEHALKDKAKEAVAHLFHLPHKHKDIEVSGSTRGELRQKIMHDLEKVGLYVQHKESADKKSIFVLVNASEELLERTAELMELELRLKDEYGGGFSRFSIANKHLFRLEGVLGSLPTGIKTIPHKWFKAHPPKIHDPENNLGLTIFNKTRRQQIILDLIQGDSDIGCAELNLGQLQADGIIIKSFVTHSGKARKTLVDVWVKRKFHHETPIQAVRHYFGEEIAFYFDYLDHYTRWLVPASIVGAIVFIIGYSVGKDHGWSNTIYSAFIILWATFYLESWKRQRSTQAWFWNMWDYKDIEETRPGFKGEESLGAYVGDEWVPLSEKDPQYGIKPAHKIPYFPMTITDRRRVHGFVFIAMLCLLVIAVTANLLAFRIFIRDSITNPEYSLAPSVIGGIMNALLIMILNKLYTGVAYKLTDWENHRTVTAYNNNLLLKLFLFRFVNSYTSLYYMAFFKSGIDIWGSPALKDECTDATGGLLGKGCTADLSIQLITLMGTNVAMGLLQEVILPYLTTKLGDYKKKLPCFGGEKEHLVPDSDDVENAYVPHFKSAKLLKPPKYERENKLNTFGGTLDEYSEMVIQYGYITLFAASFPIAPLLALLNNIIENRADALKMLTAYNKPFYHGADGIGGWQIILEVMGVISVVTNCLLLGYSYNAIYYLFDSGVNTAYYTLITIVVIEHLLLFLKFVIALAIPDVPPKIRALVARQTYIQEQLMKKFNFDASK